MRINEVKSNIVFRSGYPTFGTGSLSYKENLDTYDLIYLGFKPSGILKQDHKLDLKA